MNSRPLSRRKLARSVAPAVDAALNNEAVTRQRVEVLERWAQQFSGMGLWARLRWVCLGR